MTYDLDTTVNAIASTSTSTTTIDLSSSNVLNNSKMITSTKINSSNINTTVFVIPSSSTSTRIDLISLPVFKFYILILNPKKDFLCRKEILFKILERNYLRSNEII